MSVTTHTPKRIADYFFMVGLRDEDSLIPSDDEEEFEDEVFEDDNSNNQRPPHPSLTIQPVSPPSTRLSPRSPRSPTTPSSPTGITATTSTVFGPSSPIQQQSRDHPARALIPTSSTGHGPSKGQQQNQQQKQQGRGQGQQQFGRTAPSPSKTAKGREDVILATRPLNEPDADTPAATATATAPTAATGMQVGVAGTAATTKTTAGLSSAASPMRARSYSMAHIRPIIAGLEKSENEPTSPGRSTAQQRGAPVPPMRSRQQRRSSAAAQIGPPRRVLTPSNMSHQSGVVGGVAGVGVGVGLGGSSGTMLQHKPNYRHVSAGTLFKCVQEGLDFDKTIEGIQEEAEAEAAAVASGSGSKGDIHSHRKEQHPGADPTPGGTGQYNTNSKQAQSLQDLNGQAFGKPAAPPLRNRTKSPAPPSTTSDTTITARTSTPTSSIRTTRKRLSIIPKPDQHDIHPGDRTFPPLVTCRYPETNWPDSDVFPNFLPMFCFPGELSFKMSDEKPPMTYHSFVLTQETGSRSYAMCVTMYERLPQRMHDQLDILCQRWTRSHMSESEMEYAKAIKTKISRERRLLRSLQMQLREEKTLGRRARQNQIEREITDTEEKLSLLDDQMKPWRGLFVEIEDAWMPRCIGLVSAIPYHYLLRDWLLAIVVACSGGVEHPGMNLSSMRLESYVKNLIHEVNLPPFGKLEVGITINNRVIYASRPALNSVPIVKNFSLFPLFRCLTAEDIVTVIEIILSEGKIIFLSSYLGMLTLASESFLYLLFPLYWQGVYIPILPSALMTCLQAPVPYIIGIERKSRDSDFPPEDACVVDLDKGTINVQLAPTPLPPRQRRKLIQSLEQYAPTSAIKRSAAVQNPALGPPVYVQEAFPHSRLTLFCGVSRAPRWNKRPLPAVPGGPGDRSTVHGDPRIASAANSSSISMASTSRDHGPLPNLPSYAGQVKKSSTLENLPWVLSEQQQQQQRLMMQNQDSRTSLVTVGGMARSSSEDTLDQKSDAASRMSKSTSDSFKTNSRKVLSPARARANLLETPKRQEGSNTSNTTTSNNQIANSATMPPSHPNSGVSRNNSRHSTHMTSVTINSNYDGPGLTHRASFTSIDSTTSSILSKSPISTMTSINGAPSSNAMSHGLHLNGYSDDDGLLVGSHGGGSTDQEKVAPITIEGHVLLPIHMPVPLSLLNGRCGICSRGLAPHNEVHRCEGCSLYVHAGCLDELLYPCVPRGFDESGVCWSVLQMWAGLLKSYRSGILAGAALQQQLQQQSFHHQHQQQQQHQYQQHQQHHQQPQHTPPPHASPRSLGHRKQPSSSGSENEREGSTNGGRDRLSWASFQRWAGKSYAQVASSNVNGAGGNGGGGSTKGSVVLSPSSNRNSTNLDQINQSTHYNQQQQASPVAQRPPQPTSQPLTRARNGTEGSTHSDTVTFHRDVFMKGVDKEARPFMSVFTESQAFVQFVQDRVDRSPGDPEIMFFDEVIKAKINRSRFRLGKEETKFLD
ncbi:hypothetical protein EC957_007334 [Mortierella hygrophila]|uniref:Uncharacterized protein n=1 Tax=Mortierella hygrophila TaxID=979708 RepID=A0A9P6FD33_9FUNG|nr:hypothetical protein EC957_007334 [Mortierella hygrophila]